MHRERETRERVYYVLVRCTRCTRYLVPCTIYKVIHRIALYYMYKYGNTRTLCRTPALLRPPQAFPAYIYICRTHGGASRCTCCCIPTRYSCPRHDFHSTHYASAPSTLSNHFQVPAALPPHDRRSRQSLSAETDREKSRRASCSKLTRYSVLTPRYPQRRRITAPSSAPLAFVSGC